MHVIAPHLTADAAAGRSGLAAAIRDHAWTLGVAVVALLLNVEHLFGVDAIARVLEFHPGAPWWTYFTSHLVHVNFDQFLLSIVVFVVLGLSLEPDLRRRLPVLLGVGAVAIGVWVSLVVRIPYRGLSGLDNVLWGLAIVGAAREGPLGRWRAAWLTFGVLFKTGWEFAVGTPLWCPNLLGEHGVVVPSAHLVGLVVGLLGGVRLASMSQVSR